MAQVKVTVNIEYFKLKMRDKKWHIFRRIVIPKPYRTQEDMGWIFEDEKEVDMLVSFLNEA